jgi:hypothetical protein
MSKKALIIIILLVLVLVLVLFKKLWSLPETCFCITQGSCRLQLIRASVRARTHTHSYIYIYTHKRFSLIIQYLSTFLTPHNLNLWSYTNSILAF